MSKACQNCNKRQNVVINKKLYCASCGEPIYQTAPKPQTKPAKAKSATKAHTLDLTHHRAQVSRSAQSMHGQASAPRKSAPVASKQTAASSRAQKQQARAQRAQAVARHPQVKRFNNSAAVSQPVRQAVPRKAVKPMTPHQTYHVNKPPAPKGTKHQVTQTSRTSRLRRRTDKVRDNLKFLGRRRQLAPALVIVATCLVLAGYITYLNVPSIAVRIAASRAGVDAQLPNYRPPGYAFGGLVNYSKGQLTVRFSDDQSRSYVDLTQRRSQWDPQTLLENYVTPKSPNFIPFNQNGLTVYIYDGNKAAWINNGFFYTLEGDNRLSQDQILKMAASL